MQTRVPLSEVRPGEYVYRVGTRTVDAVAVAIEQVEPGRVVYGPKGGAYRLTAAGAAELRVLVTTGRGRPLVKANATATVERDEQAPAPAGEPLPARHADPRPWTAVDGNHDPAPFDPHAARAREARENRRLFPGGCGLCGEPADAEMGEFWLDATQHPTVAHTHAKGDPEDTRTEHGVIAHAQCGIDAGLELA